MSFLRLALLICALVLLVLILVEVAISQRVLNIIFLAMVCLLTLTGTPLDKPRAV